MGWSFPVRLAPAQVVIKPSMRWARCFERTEDRSRLELMLTGRCRRPCRAAGATGCVAASDPRSPAPQEAGHRHTPGERPCTIMTR